MATTVTSTIKSSGGDYSSLSAWEAAKQANIVTADEIQQAECYSFADTTRVDIDGWTTDSTRYIRIYTPAAERPATPAWDAAKYTLTASFNGDGIIGVYEDYVRIEGIQVRNTDTGTDAQGVIRANSCVELRVSNCILRDGRYGLWAYSGATKCWNTIIYGGASGAVNVNNAADCYLYSVSSYGGADGFRIQSGTTTVAKNCYARYYPAGWTKTTCASEDTSGTSGLQSISYNTTNFTNVTGGSEDWALPSGSALVNVGTNTSGDSAPFDFVLDFSGDTRSGTWDIGADEYVAAGGTNPKGPLGNPFFGPFGGPI